jgi:hypothetical protein
MSDKWQLLVGALPLILSKWFNEGGCGGLDMYLDFKKKC